MGWATMLLVYMDVTWHDPQVPTDGERVQEIQEGATSKSLRPATVLPATWHDLFWMFQRLLALLHSPNMCSGL